MGIHVLSCLFFSVLPVFYSQDACEQFCWRHYVGQMYCQSKTRAQSRLLFATCQRKLSYWQEGCFTSRSPFVSESFLPPGRHWVCPWRITTRCHFLHSSRPESKTRRDLWIRRASCSQWYKYMQYVYHFIVKFSSSLNKVVTWKYLDVRTTCVTTGSQ